MSWAQIGITQLANNQAGWNDGSKTRIFGSNTTSDSRSVPMSETATSTGRHIMKMVETKGDENSGESNSIGTFGSVSMTETTGRPHWMDMDGTKSNENNVESNSIGTIGSVPMNETTGRPHWMEMDGTKSDENNGESNNIGIFGCVPMNETTGRPHWMEMDGTKSDEDGTLSSIGTFSSNKILMTIDETKSDGDGESSSIGTFGSSKMSPPSIPRKGYHSKHITYSYPLNPRRKNSPPRIVRTKNHANNEAADANDGLNSIGSGKMSGSSIGTFASSNKMNGLSSGAASESSIGTWESDVMREYRSPDDMNAQPPQTDFIDGNGDGSMDNPEVDIATLKRALNGEMDFDYESIQSFNFKPSLSTASHAYLNSKSIAERLTFMDIDNDIFFGQFKTLMPYPDDKNLPHTIKRNQTKISKRIVETITNENPFLESESSRWATCWQTGKVNAKKNAPRPGVTSIDNANRDGISASLKFAIPNPNDVLFGQSKNLRYHPGNRKRNELIETYYNAYNDPDNTKSQKTKISMMVVQDIMDLGGRFLKQPKREKITSIMEAKWVEIHDLEEVRSKVTSLFRDFRARHLQMSLKLARKKTSIG